MEDIKRKIINKIKNTELIIFHDGSRDSTHEILLKLKRKLKFRYIYKKERRETKKMMTLLECVAAPPSLK